ncbi:hypothetical protein F2P81_013262 [Scophthalmus maximus]|uniref:Uncharacterized protein n=1 Tax=Scophthalmus maximus TaxID=52904 RepID=A0A6A4SWQ3_SCOMX|nr:hypothetical protein F2P81_013262 [Scophthalmus maximus]
MKWKISSGLFFTMDLGLFAFEHFRAEDYEKDGTSSVITSSSSAKFVARRFTLSALDMRGIDMPITGGALIKHVAASAEERSVIISEAAGKNSKDTVPSLRRSTAQKRHYVVMYGKHLHVFTGNSRRADFLAPVVSPGDDAQREIQVYMKKRHHFNLTDSGRDE